MFGVCICHIYPLYLLFSKNMGDRPCPLLALISEYLPNNNVISGILRTDKCLKREEIIKKYVIIKRHISYLERFGSNSWRKMNKVVSLLPFWGWLQNAFFWGQEELLMNITYGTHCIRRHYSSLVVYSTSKHRTKISWLNVRWICAHDCHTQLCWLRHI
jgi:hypothetical protein